jgi:DNA invertase Pin-like site-specific DNA recombinase
VTAPKIGYARVSADAQDLTAQRDALDALGVQPDRVYVDHGFTGTHRDRPGLRQTARGVPRRRRARGDQARPARPLAARRPRDRRRTYESARQAQPRGSVHDPDDPVGRLLFNLLAMVAEFEADLIGARTREGMKVAKARRRLRGKQPKLSPIQEAHLVELYRAGDHTVSELEELFSVTRSTVYRAVRRAGGRASAAPGAAV